MQTHPPEDVAVTRVPSRRDEYSNRDNINSAVGHSLANVNDVLNLSASQNDSDLSMPDIGGPLESINEES
ncbi:5879_t:CDS:2 [Dentiscutata erythropus]|uniref:5879_t:CDS:1 n=1 Tax=Dentiscutata erythropus TaxID=1348616 RepID=A0A9N9HKN4_9GLOM|nr:5879_t:CDS:2 [Dentiscutata erythropus]